MKASTYVMLSLVGHWVHNNTHANGVFCPFDSVPGNREHKLHLKVFCMGSKPMFQQPTSVVTFLAFLSLYRVNKRGNMALLLG